MKATTDSLIHEMNKQKDLPGGIASISPVVQKFFQVGEMAIPSNLKYGLSATYGSTIEEAKQMNAATVLDMDISESEYAVLSSMETEYINSAAKSVNAKHIGNLYECCKQREDGTRFLRAKLHLSDQVQIYDINDKLTSIDALKAGAQVLAIVKLSSVWRKDKNCGLSLRVKKVKIVSYAEKEADILPDFI